MKIIDLQGKQSYIQINREELLIINSALNEICNGIALFEFETRIGADRERVAKLLKEVNCLLAKIDSVNQ
jgi:hypothetical protein